LFTQIGFPERGFTWEPSSDEDFISGLGSLIDSLETKEDLPQKNTTRPSRLDRTGQFKSFPSSRDVSTGPATRRPDSPQIFPLSGSTGSLTTDQHPGKTLGSSNGGLVINYTVRGNETTLNPHSAAPPPTGFLNNIPGFVGSTVMQVAQDPTAVLPSSGLTPTVKAALGVGVSTAVASIVGAASSASNAVVTKYSANEAIKSAKDQLTISKGTLNEAERKNFVDETMKRQELDMTAQKQALEIAKLKHEQASREEAERAKVVAASLRGMPVPRNGFRNDGDPPDDPPAAASGSQGLISLSSDLPPPRVESHRVIYSARAAAPTNKFVDITEERYDSEVGSSQVQRELSTAHETVAQGALANEMEDLYSDDSGYANYSLRQPNRVQEVGGEGSTATHPGSAILRDQKENHEYEMAVFQPNTDTAISTAVPQSDSIPSRPETFDAQEGTDFRSREDEFDSSSNGILLNETPNAFPSIETPDNINTEETIETPRQQSIILSARPVPATADERDVDHSDHQSLVEGKQQEHTTPSIDDNRLADEADAEAIQPIVEQDDGNMSAPSTNGAVPGEVLETDGITGGEGQQGQPQVESVENKDEQVAHEESLVQRPLGQQDLLPTPSDDNSSQDHEVAETVFSSVEDPEVSPKSTIDDSIGDKQVHEHGDAAIEDLNELPTLTTGSIEETVDQVPSGLGEIESIQT
jgi:hypothetical protein